MKTYDTFLPLTIIELVFIYVEERERIKLVWGFGAIRSKFKSSYLRDLGKFTNPLLALIYL